MLPRSGVTPPPVSGTRSRWLDDTPPCPEKWLASMSLAHVLRLVTASEKATLPPPRLQLVKEGR